MLSDPTILDRVIGSKRGDLPPDLARQVLKFRFPRKDRDRYKELSYKAQDGALTARERADLEDYLNVNDLLMVLKAKPETSLRNESPLA